MAIAYIINNAMGTIFKICWIVMKDPIFKFSNTLKRNRKTNSKVTNKTDKWIYQPYWKEQKKNQRKPYKRI